MERVTGIGGIFFKADDPDALKAWYRDHLGIIPDGDGCVSFKWLEKTVPRRQGYTVWAPFPRDTKYFDPSEASFMVNFRVADLNRLLAALRAEGVEVDPQIEESEFGRFAWVMDPEGNRVELWEPPPEPAGDS